MRKAGPRGGTIGGPGGMRHGSMAGDGMCRRIGSRWSMMMGGMAGGADGGFLCPVQCIGSSL